MSIKFDHKKKQTYWKEKWQKEEIYSPNIITSKKPFYNLMMFPYPSAEGLHVGNMYAFTGTDIHGRFKRMNGHDVFEPMGLDGFGIHSENYAIKVGRHPKEHAKISEENFYNQLSKIGNGFDWSKKLETYDPDYYRWTQWLFIQMFKAGLAYNATATVNWCPKDKTVLSDEQVLPAGRQGENGKCERCGTEVVRREMTSWFFKITNYADRLLDNLEKIDWPKKIKIAQSQWIGRKQGININYPVKNSDNKNITCFTTRPDTNFGATFIVVAPEYAQENLLKLISKDKQQDISDYINTSLSKSEQERKVDEKQKTGVFTGLYAVNQLNGFKMPIWVADYVLMGFGTGAVVGVPGHDKRDFEFAKKYDLDIKPVVAPKIDYVDSNAKAYYTKRHNLHKDLLQKILAKANQDKIKTLISGGWAVTTQIGQEFRNHEDIDLIILKRDIKWWKKLFESLELEISNMFPEGKNIKYYFQATKQDIHIDVVVIELNESGDVTWLDSIEPKESDKFNKMFEQKKLFGNDVYVMNKNLIYHLKNKHGGEKRWKESIDNLFMKMEAFEEDGIMINSDFLNGLSSQAAIKKMMDYLEKKGWGEKTTTYHLRDWGISRQRYWGPPIPMINCKKCGWVPEAEENLPVILPDVKDFKPKGDGTSPLSNAPDEWKFVDCPECGGEAERELDVSDTFLDSSWYFLAYPNLDTDEYKGLDSRLRGNDKLTPFNKDVLKKWFPVDTYIGGAEHAVLHLLYARFVWMMLIDQKFLPKELGDEPFPFLFSHGLIIKDGAKMSKSKGNVINPDDYIEKYGADAFRTYLMFLGPYEGGGDFRDSGIEGMNRFQNKIWELLTEFNDVILVEETDSRKLANKLHKTIKKVTNDIKKFHYNTAISAIMELVNLMRELKNTPSSRTQIRDLDSRLRGNDNNVWGESLKALVQLIAPFMPFMAEEAWVNILEEEFSVHNSSWPKYVEELIVDETVNVVIQINGKLRATLDLNIEDATDEAHVLAQALNNENITKYVSSEKNIKRKIFVPGKILNLVV